jgi:threonylcarbamoyladenosine tRNA methylthiotransferase MtaB
MNSSDLAKPRAAVHTLGCRLNQAESSIMEKGLEDRGWDLADFKDQADLAIINTCTVTSKADSDCRASIRAFVRRNPKAFVAVVGCYSQMGYKQIAEIPGVDLIIGNQDKLQVLDFVKLGKNDTPLVIRDRIVREDFVIDTIGQSDSRTRANLKIQDGCDFMCTFCIIPMARGRARSRDLANLVEEARVLQTQGFKEIILTGVNVGTYDNSGCDIVGVVDAVAANAPGVRIRISSIEPTTIPEGLLTRMADPNHALVPYLHLPLQSGSDKVLEIMKRRYTRGQWLAFVNDAVARVPDLCIGTDVMVGMPGEDDDAFAETVEFLTQAPVAYFHVFTFSERPGTPAEKMEDKVPEPVKQRRNAVLRRLSERRREEFQKISLGRQMAVLFESLTDGFWSGYTANFIRVAVADPGYSLENCLALVRLDAVTADFVTGTLVE